MVLLNIKLYKLSNDQAASSSSQNNDAYTEDSIRENQDESNRNETQELINKYF